MQTTQGLITRLQTKVAESSEEAIAYAVSLLCTALAAFAGALDANVTRAIAPGIFYAAVVLLVYGFLSYLLPAISSVSNSLLVKAIWAGTFLAATTFTLALSARFVNAVLEVPISAFVYTQVMVALLISPLVAAASGIFVAAVCMPFFMIDCFSGSSGLSLKSILLLPTKFRTTAASQGVAVMRFFALIAVITLCASLLSSAESYSKQVDRFIKWFAYNLETDGFSYCDAKTTQRVAYLDGNLAIYATEVGHTYSFEVGECEQDKG